MPHADLADERARLEFATACLEMMRRRTAANVADEDILAANEADAEAVRWQLQRRLASLEDDADVFPLWMKLRVAVVCDVAWCSGVDGVVLALLKSH